MSQSFCFPFLLKTKAQLNQLVNWKLWVALFYPEQSVESWQNMHISQASEVFVWPRKKIRQKKFTEANFSNLVTYLLYTYWKKSTEKLWAKSILWAKLDMRILQRLALNKRTKKISDEAKTRRKLFFTNFLSAPHEDLRCLWNMQILSKFNRLPRIKECDPMINTSCSRWTYCA